MRNVKKIVLFVISVSFFASCDKDKEKFEPAYTATTEFQGFDQAGKAKMLIVGDVVGPTKTSSPLGETLHCDTPDDLKLKMDVNDTKAKWRCSFNFYKRWPGKDKYDNATVIKKL